MNQALLDKIFQSLIRDIADIGIKARGSQDLGDLSWGFALEVCLAGGKFIHQHAEAPDIVMIVHSEIQAASSQEFLGKFRWASFGAVIQWWPSHRHH